MMELISATVLTLEKKVIADTAGGARSVHAADVDNDGYMDILSASSYDDTIACCKLIYIPLHCLLAIRLHHRLHRVHCLLPLQLVLLVVKTKRNNHGSDSNQT